MNSWKKEEFEVIRPQLENISLEDLKKIAKKTGVEFTDDPEMKNITKEDIILVLDETDPEELKAELKKC